MQKVNLWRKRREKLIWKGRKKGSREPLNENFESQEKDDMIENKEESGYAVYNLTHLYQIYILFFFFPGL